MRTPFMSTMLGSFLAAALTLVLLGGDAYADDAIARHMAQGKDYDAARSAAQREKPLAVAPAASQAAREHARQMSRGKDHWMVVLAEGLDVPRDDSQQVAARHAREMNLGKDHYAAWDAARSHR
jgi:hypothetical protein